MKAGSEGILKGMMAFDEEERGERSCKHYRPLEGSLGCGKADPEISLLRFAYSHPGHHAKSETQHTGKSTDRKLRLASLMEV